MRLAPNALLRSFPHFSTSFVIIFSFLSLSSFLLVPLFLFARFWTIIGSSASNSSFLCWSDCGWTLCCIVVASARTWISCSNTILVFCVEKYRRNYCFFFCLICFSNFGFCLKSIFSSPEKCIFRFRLSLSLTYIQVAEKFWNFVRYFELFVCARVGSICYLEFVKVGFVVVYASCYSLWNFICCRIFLR